MVRTFPQFSYHFCPFYNASVLTERLRFAILRTVQMSGDHRHQRPLTSLEKQDSWLSGLLYHVIFFSDLYKSRNNLTWYKQRLPLLVKSINHESTSRRFFFIWRKNEARNPVRSAFVASLKRQSGFLGIWVTAGQKLETADYKPLKTRQRRDI